jgi:hypothetical protein
VHYTKRIGILPTLQKRKRVLAALDEAAVVAKDAAISKAREALAFVLGAILAETTALDDVEKEIGIEVRCAYFSPANEAPARVEMYITPLGYSYSYDNRMQEWYGENAGEAHRPTAWCTFHGGILRTFEVAVIPGLYDGLPGPVNGVCNTGIQGPSQREVLEAYLTKPEFWNDR